MTVAFSFNRQLMYYINSQAQAVECKFFNFFVLHLLFCGTLSGMAKKRGRPSLEPENRKNTRVQVRVTQEERKRLNAIAKAAGKTLADWAREILLTHINERPIIKE